MTTYSLLQVSLEQTIDRESLEMASDVVPSLARADCAHLQRDFFGIVVSNLPLQEATAFQAELKRRGFPTDLVADHELPDSGVLLNAYFEAPCGGICYGGFIGVIVCRSMRLMKSGCHALRLRAAGFEPIGWDQGFRQQKIKN